jgi:hypothetical protein
MTVLGPPASSRDTCRIAIDFHLSDGRSAGRERKKTAKNKVFSI